MEGDHARSDTVGGQVADEAAWIYSTTATAAAGMAAHAIVEAADAYGYAIDIDESKSAEFDCAGVDLVEQGRLNSQGPPTPPAWGYLHAADTHTIDASAFRNGIDYASPMSTTVPVLTHLEPLVDTETCFAVCDDPPAETTEAGTAGDAAPATPAAGASVVATAVVVTPAATEPGAASFLDFHVRSGAGDTFENPALVCDTNHERICSIVGCRSPDVCGKRNELRCATERGSSHVFLCSAHRLHVRFIQFGAGGEIMRICYHCKRYLHPACFRSHKRRTCWQCMVISVKCAHTLKGFEIVQRFVLIPASFVSNCNLEAAVVPPSGLLSWNSPQHTFTFSRSQLEPQDGDQFLLWFELAPTPDGTPAQSFGSFLDNHGAITLALRWQSMLDAPFLPRLKFHVPKSDSGDDPMPVVCRGLKRVWESSSAQSMSRSTHARHASSSPSTPDEDIGGEGKYDGLVQVTLAADVDAVEHLISQGADPVLLENGLTALAVAAKLVEISRGDTECTKIYASLQAAVKGIYGIECCPDNFCVMYQTIDDEEDEASADVRAAAEDEPSCVLHTASSMPTVAQPVACSSAMTQTAQSSAAQTIGNGNAVSDLGSLSTLPTGLSLLPNHWPQAPHTSTGPSSRSTGLSRLPATTAPTNAWPSSRTSGLSRLPAPTTAWPSSGSTGLSRLPGYTAAWPASSSTSLPRRPLWVDRWYALSTTGGGLSHVPSHNDQHSQGATASTSLAIVSSTSVPQSSQLWPQAAPTPAPAPAPGAPDGAASDDN